MTLRVQQSMSDHSTAQATKLSVIGTHLVEAGWLVLLVVTPLYFHFAASRHFEEAKVVLVRLIVGVVLFAWIASRPGRAQTAQAGHLLPWTKRLGAWLKAPLVLPALFLVLTHVLSTAASLRPGQSLWGAHARLQGLYTDLACFALFLFVATYLRTREQLHRLIGAVVLASVPVALYGVFQRFGGDPFTSGALDRVHASLGNAVFLAAFLIMVVPLTLLKTGEPLVALLGRRTPRRPQVWLLAVFGGVLFVQLLAIEFTKSRGPLLGLFAGLFVMVLAILLALRRNLWVAWLAVAMLAAVALLGANLQRGPWVFVSESLGAIPGLERLAKIGQEREESRNERQLSWDAAVRLFSAEQAIGLPDDELAPRDKLRAIRPVLGYGPEMIQASLLSVYPPELALTSFRSLVPNRVHNQTMDALITTGALGVLAYYAFVIALLMHAVRGFGGESTRGDQWTLAGLMTLGALTGVVVAYVLDTSGPRFTYSGLGLSFGLLTGLIAALVVRGVTQIRNAGRRVPLSWDGALSMALVAAIMGHVLEVQFSFVMPVTSVYFWIFAGVIAARHRIPRELETQRPASPQPAEPAARPVGRKRRKSRRGRRARVAQDLPADGTSSLGWITSRGIVAAALLVTYVFCFVTTKPGFSGLVLGGLVVTFLVGLVATVAEAVSRGAENEPGVRLYSAVKAYAPLSLGSVLAFAAVHALQLGRFDPLPSSQRVVANAGVLTTSWLVFLLGLLILMLLFARTLAGHLGHLPNWNVKRSWAYLLLASLLLPLMWFKDVSVARADIYARESQRYQDIPRWQDAVTLRRLACELDGGNDSCPVSLAMLYRGLSEGQSAATVASNLENERQALERARQVNPFNAEHLANLARFHLILGRRGDPMQLGDALSWAEKALALAPYDVRKHNLCATVLMDMERYDLAEEKLRAALELDDSYVPSWQRLGDALTLQGRHDEAFELDRRALRHAAETGASSAFVDRGFDGRLGRYRSAGRLEDLIAFLEELSAAWPGDATLEWALGRAYEVLPDDARAVDSYRRALPLLTEAAEANPGDSTLERRLSIVHGALGVEHIENARYSEGAEALERALALDADNPALHKNLGVVYFYHLGRKQEGVSHLKRTLELRPDSPEATAIMRVIAEHERAPEP